LIYILVNFSVILRTLYNDNSQRVNERDCENGERARERERKREIERNKE